MTRSEDFDLVVGQGQLEKPSGIRGRRRLHESLPQLAHGFELVFRGRDGNLSAGSGGLTAGERYWFASATWFKIDVTSHDLTYEFAHKSSNGRSGYVITISVSARVTSAIEVVARNVHGVRAYILSVLASRVDASVESVDGIHTGSDDVSSLTKARVAIEREIKRNLTVGTTLPVQDWLEVLVLSVHTELDADTQRHLDALLEAERTAEVAAAHRRNKQREATDEIELRGKWAGHLSERLGDSLSRAVEVAASNPTAENIDRVVQRLDAGDRDARGEFVAVLRSLIDKDIVVDAGDITAFRAILTELQGKGNARQDASAADKLVVGSDRVEPLTSSPGARDAPTIEDSDKNWSG